MDDNETGEPANVFKFGSVKGGKEEEDAIPQNDYFVVDDEGAQYEINGFLIFTPHHLAIMRDEGKGAVPALVLPIARVKVAVLSKFVDDGDE